jgi:signal transduction histidine kinase
MTTDQRSAPDRRAECSADEQRLRSIVESMADGIIVVNGDGIIRFANPAAERLLQRSSQELVDTYLGFPAVAGESTEIDLLRPHGETVAVELRVVATEWEGHPAQLASLRDITDRRRAAERAAQLEQERAARTRAEAASEAKSEFLATMSHELRTPLNAIIGYAELLDLRVAGSLAAEHRQQLARIRDSAHHLLGLVNEVLDLAKGDAGRLSLARGPGLARDVVDAALSLLQPAAESRAIELSSVEETGAVRQAGPSLRSGRQGSTALHGGPSTYYGDEDRVRQILVHLLTNAVKFTPVGGRVSVSYGRANRPNEGSPSPRAGPGVYISVVDTGSGIPPEQLGGIFDPFVQVHGGRTRTVDGSGLGLTVCRRLAELMDGEISVQSEVGKGSTFTLWLPAAIEDSDGSLQEPGSPSPVDRRRLVGLTEIGLALHRELDAVLEAFVERLRGEDLVPNVRALPFAQLADHLTSYVATIGTSLMAVEQGDGQPSGLLTDGSDILRMLADRHGAQRQRLGWTPAALEREWELFAEELHLVMGRSAPSVAASTLAEAGMIVDRYVEHARETSLRSFARAAAR